MYAHEPAVLMLSYWRGTGT